MWQHVLLSCKNRNFQSVSDNKTYISRKRTGIIPIKIIVCLGRCWYKFNIFDLNEDVVDARRNFVFNGDLWKWVGQCGAS